jgi:DNA-binding winged helix-turn-helix (wHTH) protein
MMIHQLFVNLALSASPRGGVHAIRSGSGGMIYEFDGLELDSDLFELRANGTKVAAQPKVLQFLFFLAAHHPKAVDRKEVIANVWGSVVVTDAALARVVMEARRAIGDAKQERLVTVRGRGFRLAVTLKKRDAAPAETTPRAPERERDVTIAATTKGATAERGGLVGRELCMAALETRLADALSGRRRFAIVSGPAGIGKTRVLEELARTASARDALVCMLVVRSGAPALSPWHALLETLSGALTDLDVSAARKTLADTPNEMARLVGKTALVRPLCILLDDIQHADHASIALLLNVIRNTSGARVLIVATHRDGATEGDASAASMRELFGDSSTLSIPLRPLSADETAQIVESVTRVLPSPSVAAAIHRRAGGIPHYVHQLIETSWVEKAMRDESKALASSIDLQPGIIESISRHLGDVSTNARDVLVTAALLGQDIAFATLLGATGLRHDDLHARLAEAIGARLLVATKNNSYAFAHALVSDVLRKGLSEPERAKRHRLIAERLVAHYGASANLHAAEVALHFVRSLSEGDPEPAIAFSMLAADQSELTGDVALAAKQWSNAAHALSLARHYDARRSRVLLSLARARSRTGDASGALEACLDAVLLARAFQRPEALADAVLQFWEMSDRDDARRAVLLREARSALDAAVNGAEDGSSAERRRRLAALAG